MTEVTTPRGRVLPDPDGHRVEYRRTVPEPPAELWAALTEPARLERWIGTWTADGTPGVGSTVQFVMLAEEDAEAEPVTIRECDPPRLLVVDWHVPDEAMWRVEVTLTPAGGATDLLFVQRMSEPEGLGEVGPGWHYYLDRLQASLAGTDLPRWDDYYPALRDAYGPAARG
ncbi:MAG: hypothetical protein QOC93_2695 [Actinomycetota bacterium]|jgi:uncharacterized protein YndB with AHSA1/START domain|nr:hypothetical protein [Cryptosporangiaceae bacterium]MDQ1677551.1 hypothetical protein [Actinomycetota bacterium]